MPSLKLIGQMLFELESRNHTRTDGQTDVGPNNLIGRLVTRNPPSNPTGICRSWPRNGKAKYRYFEDQSFITISWAHIIIRGYQPLCSRCLVTINIGADVYVHDVTIDEKWLGHWWLCKITSFQSVSSIGNGELIHQLFKVKVIWFV